MHFSAQSIAPAKSTRHFTSSAQVHSSTHEKNGHRNHGTVQKSGAKSVTTQMQYNKSKAGAVQANMNQLGSKYDAKEMENTISPQNLQKTNFSEQSPSYPPPTQSDVERRLSGREDSDYWSSPSPSIQYFRGMHTYWCEILFYLV